MIRPSYRNIRNLLGVIDWSGHVELPDTDLAWLAEQLSAHLSATSLETCDSCGRSMIVVVTTKLGNICSECLEEASDTADSIRDVLTGGDVDVDRKGEVLAKGGSLTRS
jgi:hypothetical protein